PRRLRGRALRQRRPRDSGSTLAFSQTSARWYGCANCAEPCNDCKGASAWHGKPTSARHPGKAGDVPAVEIDPCGDLFAAGKPHRSLTARIFPRARAGRQAFISVQPLERHRAVVEPVDLPVHPFIARAALDRTRIPADPVETALEGGIPEAARLAGQPLAHRVAGG